VESGPTKAAGARCDPDRGPADAALRIPLAEEGIELTSQEGAIPKLLYIAGWARSGSTLVEQVVGQIEGWFPCGEVNHVWNNFVCGCGVPAFDCEFWKPILNETLARHPGLDAEAAIALRDRALAQSPGTLAAITREAKRGLNPDSPRARYKGLLLDLYASIARATGARVLIDSSKTAADAYLIAALSEIELYVLHLVRDPRATAYSWSRKKEQSYDPPVYFGRLSPHKSSINWLRRHAVIELFVRPRQRSRYMRMRYEDFAAHPQGAALSICSFMGEPDASLPFSSERRIQIDPNHTASGNPVRFTQSELEIEIDNEWRTRMETGPRLRATLPAAPLMPRYGYPLLSRTGDDSAAAAGPVERGEF
jgi:sulfotransferase family protein